MQTPTANPVTMTAGLTAMRKFDAKEVARLNHLSLIAVEGIRAAIAKTGVPGCVTGGGSMFRVHFRTEPPKNHREGYPTPEESRRLAIMLDHLFEAGFLGLRENLPLFERIVNTISFPREESP